MNAGEAHMPPSSRDRNGLPEALAVFLEMSFDAAVVFDARERITDWTPAAGQVFGWTAQEALGKTPAKLFLPVNTPEEKKDQQQRQSRLKRGQTLRGEQACCRKDGSSLRVQYTARAFFNAEGKFGGSLAIYRAVPALVTGQADETERRLASDLRARTEEVEALLNVSPVAIFVAHDPECMRITGNPAGYRLVELPAQANISKSAPDEERPAYRTFRNGVEVSAEDLPMQKAARLGMEINEDVLELLFEDGSRKFIYAFAKPLFDAQGQSRGAVAAMLDITERKWAEEQLEKSNQKLQEILASIQDDFYVIDHDWMFVYANRQFTSKLGKEPEDLIGNNVWEMFPKHIATALGENFRAAMEKREMRRFEISGQYTNAWYGVTVFPSTEGITVLGTDITENKRAADALRRSEARLRQMIETSLVAIGLGDSTGKIFDANEAFYRLTGYTREEIQSSQLGWDQLTASEYAELDRRMIATLVATGSAGPYEKEYIRKDGSRVSLLLTMSKLPGQDEHIAFIMDITERKRTENALAQALQELRMHIDNSPLAVIAFDPEFRVVEWSAGAEHMFGWRAEEVLNKRIPDLHWVHEEDAERVASLSADMLAGRASSSGHANRNYRKDGSVIECEWYNSALLDANGKLISVRSQVLNVTERKRAEEKLRHNEAMLQTILDNIPEAIYLKDRDSRLLLANPATFTVIGKPPEAVLGKTDAEFYDDPATGQAIMENNRRIMDSGKVEIVEETVWDRGSTRVYLSSKAPYYNAEGQVIGLIGIARDITERKRLEAETESMARFPQENPNPVLRVSREGVVLFGNRASQKLLEDWNCSIGMLLPEPWRNKVVERFRLGVPGETLFERNGRIISLHMVPIVDGQYLNIYGRDITEHKRAEEALRENQNQLQLLNETLEQKVQEKTAEVHRVAADLVQAVQHERHRISHILHYDLQQRVYAIQMQLTFLRDEFEKENEAARREISGIEKQLAEVLEVTRHLSIDLSPPILRGEGLSHAIGWLAVQMRQRHGLPVEIQADGSFAIADEALHVLLFNCVRELLFNVVKHARASRAVVTLQWKNAGIWIEVRDDGRGFPVNTSEQQVNGENASPSSLGLPTIRHQLSFFGGRMEIQSEPGAGARIILSVPATQAE